MCAKSFWDRIFFVSFCSSMAAMNRVENQTQSSAILFLLPPRLHYHMGNVPSLLFQNDLFSFEIARIDSTRGKLQEIEIIIIGKLV